MYLFLLLALISNTSYILAGLTTVSWRIVWYQNTMITKLPLMEQISATLWKRIIEVKICCYKMMVMRYWVQGQIEQVLAVSPCWIVWCVTVATIICTIKANKSNELFSDHNYLTIQSHTNQNNTFWVIQASIYCW